MRFFKLTDKDIIVAVGIGDAGEEITESEYGSILAVIRNRPSAAAGLAYRLTTGLEWEMYEPPAEETDSELSDEEALKIIIGGAV